MDSHSPEWIAFGPINAKRAHNHIALNVNVVGAYTPEGLAGALAADPLGAYLAQNATSGIALFAFGIGGFSEAHARSLATVWLPTLAGLGVRRVALVLDDNQHARAGSTFDELLRRGAVGVTVGCRARSQGPLEAWFDAVPAPESGYRTAAADQHPFQPTRVSKTLEVPPDASRFPVAWAGCAGFLLGVANSTAWSEAIRVVQGEGGFSLGTTLGGGVAGIVAGAVATHAVIDWRGRPLASLRWDEAGIAEWTGDVRRTFLPWNASSYALLETKVQAARRRGAARYWNHGGTTLQLRAGDETITVCDGSTTPLWLHGRACHVPSLQELRALLAERPPSGAVVEDARALSRRGFLAYGALALAGYAAALVGAGLARDSHLRADQAAAALVILAGSALLALRALRPWMLRSKSAHLRATEASLRVELALRALLSLAIAAPALVLLYKAIAFNA